MKKIIAAAALLACMAAPFNAQSILNRLENKAQSKITGRIDKKVDQVMDKALNKVFGVSGNDNANSSQQQSSASSSGYIDNALGLNTSFGANLYDNHFEYNLRQGYDEYELKSNLKYANYTDAISKMVDLPSVKELLDEKDRAQFAKKMQEVEAALDALVLANNNAMVAAANANLGTVETASNSKVGPLMSPEEVIQACAASGVNFMTATQDQVIDACVPVVVKKTGCTEAEARVLLSQDKNPRSESSEIDRCSKIEEQLSNIYL